MNRKSETPITEVLGLRRSNSSTRVVTIKLDEELLQKIDITWQRLGYSSRSNFLKDAVQLYLRMISLIESSTPITYDPRIQSMSEFIEKLLKRCVSYSRE
ncbi:MAG: ribbon-helix-helix domain-containing protein [Sulfolobales archaeon]